MDLKGILDLIDENYYSGNSDILSDSEYDKIVENNNFEKSSVGSSLTAKTGNSIKLGRTMYSMSKTTPETWYNKWSKRLGDSKEQAVIVMPKYDGISVLLEYDGGKLVRACTRGDGTTGKDITDRIKMIDSNLLDIEDDSIQFLTGEIICPKKNFSYFEKNYGYISCRQVVTSVLKPAITAAAYTKVNGIELLDIIIYGVDYYNDISGNGKSERLSDRLKNLKDGIKLGEILYYSKNLDGLKGNDFDSLIRDVKENNAYDCDGIILELDSVISAKALGYIDNKYPNGAIAVKQAVENQDSNLGEIDRIEWSMGANGALTPVAIMKEAVKFKDALVSKASIGSYWTLKKLGISIGSVVLLIKSGDIIPHITKVIASTGNCEVPEVCPHCGKRLSVIGADLVCTNENCCGIQKRRTLNFVSAMKVKGIGPSIIEAILCANGISDLKSFLQLPPEKWIKIPSIGPVLMKKLLVDFPKALREKDLSFFMSASGIFSSVSSAIGSVTAKKVIKILGDDYKEWSKHQVIENQDALIKEIGVSANNTLIAHIEEFLDFMSSLGFEPKKPENTVLDSEKLLNKNFVFTGFRNKELEDIIRKNGGLINYKQDSNTVCFYLGTSSAKYNKAVSVGAKLIEAEMAESYVAELLK